MAGMSTSEDLSACWYMGGDMTCEIHSPVKKDVSAVACGEVGTHF